MSTLVKDAAAALATALKTVPGVGGSVYKDPAAPNIQCPALVIGPPTLFFESGRKDPTEAHFLLWLVVDDPDGELAVEKLCVLAPEVVAAVDEYTNGVVSQPATPFPFPHTTTDLPSYQFIYEVGL